MDHAIIDKYIDKLIDNSEPGKPYWNIEVSRGINKCKWNYIDGCMTNSLLELYQMTKKKKYLDFVVSYIDYFVKDDGTIQNYDITHYSTDDMAESRILFDLYRITKKEKYRKAIDYTYEQIKGQPRTSFGNFWHKKIYHDQIWLDGIYMAQPFYLRYETEFNDMKNYNDIIGQFKNVRKYMFDKKKQLYYHGFDESKTMFWADKKTGLSQCFWLRAIGWFTVALADCCGYINEQMYDEYRYLCSLLKEIIDGLLKYQDKDSKMFYQVVDQGKREKNYLETSGSAMIAYAILKGVRLGILPTRYQQIGLDIFDGICNKYLIEKNGELDLGGICLVAGLGPEDRLNRDGSYEYYMSEPVVENDAKGVGPFIMAYIEVKRCQNE